MLLDRDQERAAIGRLLDAVREARSGVLVIRGDPGIGKTALLEFAARAADDMRVARVVGVQSELELGFAGMHQLLGTFLGSLERLPEPQREALEAAFGLSAGAPPDRFLVGLAALSLLTEAAVENPLLCIVDDAHWVDSSSLEAFRFVARRLFADRVGMLFGVRDRAEKPGSLEGLPELRLAGLPEEDAGELLAAHTDAPVAPSVLRRIAADTAGNPLALVELGRELAAGELAGEAPLPAPLRLADRLQQLFVTRVRALPAATQRLLLVAAADPSGDPALLWGAARRLGIPDDAADAADLPGVIRLEPEVAFRHPLVRSAVYQAASERDRRQTHEALAAASNPRSDPDRRAWHLAAATGRPDEKVAAELERSAARAHARGGFASGAAFLERAAELTPDASRRARRWLAAAQANVIAGDPAAASVLLQRAAPGLEDPLSQGQAKRLQGSIHAAVGDSAGAAETLLAAADTLQPLDARLARDALLDAFNAAFLAGSFAGDSATAVILRAARAAPALDPGQRTPGDMLLDGFAVLQEQGEAAGIPLLREGLENLNREQPQSGEVLRSLLIGTIAAVELLDDRALHAVTSRLVGEARSRGALTVLPTALARYGFFEVLAGKFRSADEAIAEAREIASATGIPDALGRYPLAEVASLAWRGRAGQARERAADFVSYSERIGHGMAIRLVGLGLAVLDLALGNHDTALRSARISYEDGALMGTLAMPELIEAAVGSANAAIAGPVLAALEDRAHASGTDWALGLLYRSQAIAREDDGAEELYRAGIEHLERSRILPQLGRAHLLYGEWLRRRSRRHDARRQLQAAHQIFDGIGAEAFAERARIGLGTAGERPPRRDAASRDQLTPQERHIARLASQGASNQEIAADLFISSNTVAYHLQKVFRKLGVSRRAELHSVLGE